MLNRDYWRDIVVFGGSGLNSKEISTDVAQRLGVSHAELKIEEFPDGEIYVKVPVDDITGKHIIYVQSTARYKKDSTEVPQSQSLMELFLTLDAMTEKKAKMVDVVVPYFAHTRQDKEFYAGEIVSTRTIGKILKGLCIHRVFTVDVHAHRETGAFAFGKYEGFAGVDGYNITAAKALASYVKNHLGIESPIVIIPDKGHEPIAKIVRSVLMPEDTVVLRKRRISGEIVEMDKIEARALIVRNGDRLSRKGRIGRTLLSPESA